MKNLILNVLKSNPSVESWGLRRVYAEYLPKLGDDVPFSWDWDHENDCSSEDLLGGASCVGIDIMSLIIDLEDMDMDEESDVNVRIDMAINLMKKHNYGGEMILVGGKFKGYGEDRGEFLIDGKRYL